MNKPKSYLDICNNDATETVTSKSDSTIPDDLLLTDEELGYPCDKCYMRNDLNKQCQEVTCKLWAVYRAKLETSKAQLAKVKQYMDALKETYAKLSQFSIEESEHIGELESKLDAKCKENKRLKEELRELKEKACVGVEQCHRYIELDNDLQSK